MVETQTIGSGAPVASPAPAQRYQLANHLGSASLELDEAGGLISYEEYSPYGNTTYQAGRSAAEVSLKRYRYTGKERDEENGFYLSRGEVLRAVAGEVDELATPFGTKTCIVMCGTTHFHFMISMARMMKSRAYGKGCDSRILCSF